MIKEFQKDYILSSSTSLPKTRSHQLSLFEPPPKPIETRPELVIERIPPSEGITPWRFRLVHHPSGLPLPGTFCHCEGEAIIEASRDWDWRLDRDNVPNCVRLIESLVDSVLGSRGGEQ